MQISIILIKKKLKQSLRKYSRHTSRSWMNGSEDTHLTDMEIRMEKDLLEDMVHSEDSADQAHTEAADRTERRRKKTFICEPPPTTYAADTIRKHSMYWPGSGKGVPS